MERSEAHEIRDKALAGYIAQGEHQLQALGDQINGLIKQHNDMTDEVSAMRNAQEALQEILQEAPDDPDDVPDEIGPPEPTTDQEV